MRGLYATIVSSLGGIPHRERASLIPQAADALCAEEHERGRKVVLCLDEAHLLDAEQLEGVRLLSSAEMDSHAPFACLLIGQPGLRRRIRLSAFAALDQRVALRYSMTGMETSETTGYVAHHLKLAGRSDTLFVLFRYRNKEKNRAPRPVLAQPSFSCSRRIAGVPGSLRASS